MHGLLSEYLFKNYQFIFFFDSDAIQMWSLHNVFYKRKIFLAELHIWLITKQKFSPSLHPLPPMPRKHLVLREGVFIICTFFTCIKCTYSAFSMIFCLYFKTALINWLNLKTAVPISIVNQMAMLLACKRHMVTIILQMIYFCRI